MSADHGASASAVGYLFQFDWALVEALEAYPDHADRRLAFELLDDLSWHGADGSAVSLEQLKHHGTGAGSLTDAQPDVWRTIVSWLDAGSALDPAGPALFLVTTQTAAEGSAMASLRLCAPGGADQQARVRMAVDRLDSVAASSRNKQTQPARVRWQGLSPAERLGLLSRVTVLDGAPGVDGLDRRLDKAIGHAMPGQRDVFVQRLRGWWSRIVVRLLCEPGSKVRVLDVHAFVSGLRNEFTPLDLPRTVEASDVAHLAGGGAGRQFVQQLDWIQVSPRYIELAVLDYYRAYEQRTFWATEDLIGIDELERYERDLRESWERQFEMAAAELPPDADDAARQAAGRALLRTVMADSSVLLREHYREEFFASGTRHALADVDHDGVIGWHPDFREHLEAMLSPGAA